MQERRSRESRNISLKRPGSSLNSLGVHYFEFFSLSVVVDDMQWRW